MNARAGISNRIVVGEARRDRVHLDLGLLQGHTRFQSGKSPQPVIALAFIPISAGPRGPLPDFGVIPPEILEIGGHDANYGDRFPVQPELGANHIGFSAKPALPEPLAYDDHVVVA